MKAPRILVAAVAALSGFAKTADEKARAERLARGVTGVVAVRNDIVVRG